MKELSLASLLLFLASGCTGLSTRTADGVTVDTPGPRPDGLDRWYEPQWGPPYTVSEGYVWVYRPD